MKRLTFFILFFSLWTTFTISAANDVNFSIRFHEKRIYYVGGTPVRFEAVITNNSSRTFRFKMANNWIFNFDFEVSTPSNLILDHAKEFTIVKHANQPILFREISLEPGETFGIVVSLSDFVDLDKAGLYTVRSQFFPEMNLNSIMESIYSNTVTLNVRPEVLFPEEKALIEAETGKMLLREFMPPDEVVSYMLKARQKSQWEKFLLYLDLESLYTRYPQRARSFKRMSEEDRKRALIRFEEELKAQAVDQDILLIPLTFEILRTSYTAAEASVLVTEKFQYRDYVEVKRYTYTLQRRDKIWIITDYGVQNLGTE